MFYVKKLRISAHNSSIIDSINLNIRDRDFIYIAGKSGSGKTSLMGFICGVFHENSGLSIDYESFRDTFASKRMMLQNIESQFFYFSVYDELKHSVGIRFNNNLRGYVYDIAERWGILEWLDKRIYMLSKGEQQFLLLLLLIIENPNLLILDEPTAFLDKSRSKHAIDMISKYTETGSLIISNHKSRELKDIPGKFLHISNGKINEKKWPFLEDNPENYDLFPHSTCVKRKGKELNPGESIIRLDGVCFSYDKRYILEEVSLDIQMGEWIHLCGDNGSGKSTLARIICNRLKPNFGKVVKHRDISIQFLSQDYRFFAKNNTLIEELKDFNDKVYSEYINRLGLNKVIKQDFFRLSCGEAKRVILLMALLNDPDLLIVDELEAGLDYTTLITIYNLLFELVKKRWMCIINISHEQWLGKMFASTKWELKNRRVVVSYY